LLTTTPFDAHVKIASEFPLSDFDVDVKINKRELLGIGRTRGLNNRPQGLFVALVATNNPSGVL